MPKPIDLTGKRFGRLSVIKRVENDKDGHAKWLCVCDCGNERVVLGKSLRNGHTSSCGCICREITSNKSLIDRVGQRFGRLVVISRADDYIARNGKHHVMWKCLCDCGKETTVDVCQLIQGKTKSCGCIRLEGGNRKHGGKHERLYRVFHNMIDRCYNESNGSYKYYGGRGIRICDEWLDNYPAFREWAIAAGYDANAPFGKCTIDRIDVNGDYSPGNCRWVDMAVQSRNRRNVVKKNDNSPREDQHGTEAYVS